MSDSQNSRNFFSLYNEVLYLWNIYIKNYQCLYEAIDKNAFFRVQCVLISECETVMNQSGPFSRLDNLATSLTISLLFT